MSLSLDHFATLDDDVASMIVDLGGEELLIELAETFRVDTARQRERLLEAVQGDDGAGVSSIAHALKSGSASLGAMKLSEICRALEAAGNDDCLDGVREIMVQFDDELACLEDVFRKRWS